MPSTDLTLRRISADTGSFPLFGRDRTCKEPFAATSVDRVKRTIPASSPGLGKGSRFGRNDGPALVLAPFELDGPASAMNQGNSLPSACNRYMYALRTQRVVVVQVEAGGHKQDGTRCPKRGRFYGTWKLGRAQAK